MLYLLRVEVACLGATKASGFVSSQLGQITRCPSRGHRASMSDIPLSNHIIGLSAVVPPAATAGSMDLLGLFTSTLDPDNLTSSASAFYPSRQDHQHRPETRPETVFTSARVVHRKHIQRVESPINH